MTGCAAADAGDDNEALPRSQWVIFIRHAESRWNRAQGDRSLVGMYSENDHGLTEEGRDQAEGLRARLRGVADRAAKVDTHVDRCPSDDAEAHWESILLSPDNVFSSPFTRAVTTAAIGLRDLLGPGRRPLVLLRHAREHKNVGAADSTGVAVGEEIPEHVAKDIACVYGGCSEKTPEQAEEEFWGIDVDVADVADEWWGPMLGDDADLLQDNLDGLLGRIRRTRGSQPGGGGVSVVVGHSYFLRGVFQRFLRDGLEGHVLGVPEALRCSLMPHCGVVGARFDWDAGGAPRIREAVPLLGTQLNFDLVPPATTSGNNTVAGCACARRTADGCAFM